MASKGRKKGNKWEFVVKKKGVLDKPLYLSFSDHDEGVEYCRNLEAQLARGVVPSIHEAPSIVLRLRDVFALYLRDAHPSAKDRDALNALQDDPGHQSANSLTVAWADGWISSMKREEILAPATIRAKVGAVARAIDWARRKGPLDIPENPLRSLPDGYASYTELDAKLAGGYRIDVERERRLEGDEESRIRMVIRSAVLPRTQRPRPIPDPTDLERDFDLSLETAMRLRERFTLEVHQVRLHQRTIHLDRTKNGDSRQVPMSSVAMRVMEEQIAGKAATDRVFPWWGGDASAYGLKMASSFLSKLYADVFEAAGCDDLREHDLRHEATSRLFERTTLPVEAIMKITGHKTHKMLMRYLKLRGSDLAEKLW